MPLGRPLLGLTYPRRGSRGGKNRKRPAGAAAATTAASTNGAEPQPDAEAEPAPEPEAEVEPEHVPAAEIEPEPEPAAEVEPELVEEPVAAAETDGDADWGYVPMSEWVDEIDSSR